MNDLNVGGATGFSPSSWPTMPRVPAADGGAEPFGTTLGRAVRGVNDLQAQAQDATVALASGQPVDMAQTLVTIEKANISLQFALQIRNKLLEAYQDVMRIPV
jgi:flagellar hook-basal body complex protein FliE